MGKVQKGFGKGSPGAVSRSVDDIVISVKNAGNTDIPFGAPVFMGSGGAVSFSTANPQEFRDFLGFAVRVADKTPETYPRDQSGENQAGVWRAGDVMEVLVRGGIAVSLVASGNNGGAVYIRKSNGALTGDPGTEGTTMLLENVRIRNKAAEGETISEVTVNARNNI